jgi:hypothetical protein
MRTTVTLDPDVESLIKADIRKTHRPFKCVLNDAIRAGLSASKNAPSSPPFKIVAKPLGLKSGLDPRRLGQAADELEAEAFVSVTQRLKEKRK